MTRDRRGRVFVGTEDSGLWMRDFGGAKWRHFSAQTLGFPDDAIISSLAVDRQNRVWAGTNRDGISVWNGKTWRNYNALSGVMGEHILAIAVSPFDGDVWLATNEGVTRYSNKKKIWRTYTRASGLQSDKVQAISFARNGDIVLGTQVDGIILGRATKIQSEIEYSEWRQIRAASDLPGSEPSGNGLPSNLINDVLRAQNGMLFVATTQGLAWSRDNGSTWRHLRGKDYADKVRKRLGGAPRDWKAKTGARLSEDYVTCLAQDNAGRIYVGYRGNLTNNPSYQIFDATLKLLFDSTRDAKADAEKDFVKRILPLPDGRVLLAHYGSGLSQSRFRATQFPTRPSAFSNIEYSKSGSFPLSASAPSLNELNSLLARLGKVPRRDKVQPAVIALSDDWTTRGAWQGRYGRYWAKLGAMLPVEEGGNYIWGAGSQPIRHGGRAGLRDQPHESARIYVAQLYTDNPNSLEIPQIYLHRQILNGQTTWEINRRQAENNDYSDFDKPNRQDLNVYTTLNVPAGQFVLSFYIYNDDGNVSLNRNRDYRISVRPHAPWRSLYDVTDFNSQNELARARVRDFRSGVWKRFLVTGPREVTVQLGRNYGYIAKYSAMTLDELKPNPAPYFRTVAEDRVLDEQQQTSANDLVTQRAKTYSWRFTSEKSARAAAVKLFDRLEEMRVSNPAWWATESRQFYVPLTRFLQNDQTDEVADLRKAGAARLANCYYALQMFDQFEQAQRIAALTPARDIELAQRWDGVTQVTTGKGLEIISNAVAAKNP